MKGLLIWIACITSATALQVIPKGEGFPDGHLDCGDDTCVPVHYKCNGSSECGSEDKNKRPGPQCSEKEVLCEPNHTCLSRSVLCDLRVDCTDGSDEEDCGNVQDNSFNCLNGDCTALFDQCGEDEDCANEIADEGSSSLQCLENEVPCKPTMKCLDNRHLCDGFELCPDGSDETGCHNYACQEDDEVCPSQKCLRKSWICDGIEDCPDGYDERHCENYICEDTRFKCRNHKCIPEEWRCDGDDDCKDGSDEKGCPVRREQDTFTSRRS